MELNEIPECLFLRLQRQRGQRVAVVKIEPQDPRDTSEAKLLDLRPGLDAWAVLKTTPPDAERLRIELIVYDDEVSASQVAQTARLLTVVVSDIGPLGALERRMELQPGNVTLQVSGGNRLAGLISEVYSTADMFARTVATTSREAVRR